MESKLKARCEYQKFEGNAALQQGIDSGHARYASRELNLEEMEWVNAAGTPHQPVRPEKKDR